MLRFLGQQLRHCDGLTRRPQFLLDDPEPIRDLVRAIRLLDLVQPENAESLGKAVVESANGRGKIIAEAVEQMNDGISEGGHDLGRGVFSYSAGVFAQSHVAAIVQAVLDVPVFARERL